MVDVWEVGHPKHCTTFNKTVALILRNPTHIRHTNMDAALMQTMLEQLLVTSVQLSKQMKQICRTKWLVMGQCLLSLMLQNTASSCINQESTMSRPVTHTTWNMPFWLLDITQMSLLAWTTGL